MCPPGTLKFYFSIKGISYFILNKLLSGEKTDLGEYVHFSEDLPESSRVHVKILMYLLTDLYRPTNKRRYQTLKIYMCLQLAL